VDAGGGRSIAGPVDLTLSAGRSRLARRRLDIVPEQCGGFWIAEAAFAATRVTVSVGGVAAGSASVQLLSPVPPGQRKPA